MDQRIVDLLRCPHCGGTLCPADSGLRCKKGHTFDQARQGYVDLTPGRVTHEGDTAPMVQAREAVQGAGHFAFLTDGLRDVLMPFPRGVIVDVGAGTGHHLAALLDGRPDDLGLGLDVSKAALRRAARAHPRLTAVRADAWRRLPLADHAATTLLNVFAPRDGAEFARVLAPGGRLVVVTPTDEHLRELHLTVRVDPAKAERLASTLAPWFIREDEAGLRTSLRLSGQDAAAFVAMGPNAHHQQAARPAGGTVTASVRISTWRRAEE
ncbi:ubiquinone biosynthesis protein [Virgisporangium aliadipatigenens]|uniref:Ubiquinone biosynthesis protein n=1 Tax=Virgisporangium aliadipatigenens TaxID=741659 RepID=A0A8J3YSZ9_9ACTN|nr:methyltransferase domain-containing protein [Virgisporangium aliadipatigenens]GIJ51134.1 ubiquinone biosynthesis protein [Virgisporangium aliadipatigenens]